MITLRLCRHVALGACVALAVAPTSASAQTPSGAQLEASLDRLARALQEGDVTALEPVLAPEFTAGGFTGDLARSIISQVVASGRIQPRAIRVDSTAANGEHTRIYATFHLPEGDRSHDLLVDDRARFVEINVMRVSATAEARAVGAGPEDGAPPTTGVDAALQRELLAMRDDDQRYRRALSEGAAAHDEAEVRRLMALQAPLDSANVVRLTAILDARGWPGPSLVGPEASTAAFLVLQHAPLEVQERYLPMARAAAEAGALPGPDLALLEDRVRMRRGEPQLYGSQLVGNPETGALELWPIEDEANVDARRAAVGLEPLADYLRRFGLE